MGKLGQIDIREHDGNSTVHPMDSRMGATKWGPQNRGYRMGATEWGPQNGGFNM